MESSKLNKSCHPAWCERVEEIMQRRRCRRMERMSETEKEIQGIAGCRAERTMMPGWGEDVLVWLDRAEERLGNAWLVKILS